MSRCDEGHQPVPKRRCLEWHPRSSLTNISHTRMQHCFIVIPTKVADRSRRKRQRNRKSTKPVCPCPSLREKRTFLCYSHSTSRISEYAKTNIYAFLLSLRTFHRECASAIIERSPEKSLAKQNVQLRAKNGHDCVVNTNKVT